MKPRNDSLYILLKVDPDDSQTAEFDPMRDQYIEIIEGYNSGFGLVWKPDTKAVVQFRDLEYHLGLSIFGDSK